MEVHFVLFVVLFAADSEQTVHLSSYEIVTPWRLSRERREALRPSSKQVSYLLRTLSVIKHILVAFLNER